MGDCKYLWEPNRHLHIVTLAQAYRISGDERYLRVMHRHLDSWFTACPYRMGPNWSSSLEPAMRLINWSVAWQLVGGVGSGLYGMLLYVILAVVIAWNCTKRCSLMSICWTRLLIDSIRL